MGRLLVEAVLLVLAGSVDCHFSDWFLERVVHKSGPGAVVAGRRQR